MKEIISNLLNKRTIKYILYIILFDLVLILIYLIKNDKI